MCALPGGNETELLGLFHVPHAGSSVIHLQTEGQVSCLFLMSNVMVQVCFGKYQDKCLFSCEEKFS